jgi:hypothetical protein
MAGSGTMITAVGISDMSLSNGAFFSNAVRRSLVSIDRWIHGRMPLPKKTPPVAPKTRPRSPA